MKEETEDDDKAIEVKKKDKGGGLPMVKDKEEERDGPRALTCNGNGEG